MRIGVLTSGGDVPGLNACIRAIVHEASRHNWDVIGLLRGWQGLLNLNPDATPSETSSVLVPLTRETTRGIENLGGTILHTARVNPTEISQDMLPAFLRGSPYSEATAAGYDCTLHMERVLDFLGIDALIPIGGDGSLRFAAHLHSRGFPLVSIPKTMDNDVNGTDYSIGFSTCVTRSVNCINNIRTSADSHERITLIELFGRHSGEPALLAGHIASADRVLIPECPFDTEKFIHLMLDDRSQNPRNYSIAVVAEGAYSQNSPHSEDRDRHPKGRQRLGGIGNEIAQFIRDHHGIDVITQSLAYLLRSGEPDALDKLVASSFGTLAIQAIHQKSTGTMTALHNGRYTLVDAGSCLQSQRRVDVDNMYDVQAYRPQIRRILDMPMYL
ncbi:MAG: phosphofructokinase [Alphaproteobacteria bacterium]|nr:MAG: phosphofructokinase [Alphaproteobacteria bacterium]